MAKYSTNTRTSEIKYNPLNILMEEYLADQGVEIKPKESDSMATSYMYDPKILNITVGEEKTTDKLKDFTNSNDDEEVNEQSEQLVFKHQESSDETQINIKVEVVDNDDESEDAKDENEDDSDNLVTNNCRICDIDFATPIALKVHTDQIHVSHRCSSCEETFACDSDLEFHVRIRHNNERPFKCDVCPSDFTELRRLNEHKKLHSDVRPFKCPTCNKGFITNSKLNYHQRFHDGFKPHKCEECGKCFVQSGALNVHLRTHSGIKPYECPKCLKKFSTISYFKRHVEFMHDDDNDVTGAQNKRKFKCEECEKTFVQKGDLEKHVVIHSGFKPYQCELCSKSFTQKGNLDQHVRIHTGSKPYLCEECGKSFKQSGALTVHLRSHSGYKPHACPLCSRRFTTGSMMNRHVKICKAIINPLVHTECDDGAD